MDADNSGSIDFEEFMAVMTSDGDSREYFDLAEEMDEGFQHRAFYEFATTYRRQMLLEKIEAGDEEATNSSTTSKDGFGRFRHFRELFSLQLGYPTDKSNTAREKESKRRKERLARKEWMQEVRRCNASAKSLGLAESRKATANSNKSNKSDRARGGSSYGQKGKGPGKAEEGNGAAQCSASQSFQPAREGLGNLNKNARISVIKEEEEEDDDDDDDDDDDNESLETFRGASRLGHKQGQIKMNVGDLHKCKLLAYTDASKVSSRKRGSAAAGHNNNVTVRTQMKPGLVQRSREIVKKIEKRRSRDGKGFSRGPRRRPIKGANNLNVKELFF